MEEEEEEVEGLSGPCNAMVNSPDAPQGDKPPKPVTWPPSHTHTHSGHLDSGRSERERERDGLSTRPGAA